MKCQFRHFFFHVSALVVALRVDDEAAGHSALTPEQADAIANAKTRTALATGVHLVPTGEDPVDTEASESSDSKSERELQHDFYYRKLELAKGLVNDEELRRTKTNVEVCLRCRGCLKDTTCYGDVPGEGSEGDMTELKCGYIGGIWCAGVFLMRPPAPQTMNPEDHEPMSDRLVINRFHHGVEVAQQLAKQEARGVAPYYPWMPNDAPWHEEPLYPVGPIGDQMDAQHNRRLQFAKDLGRQDEKQRGELRESVCKTCAPGCYNMDKCYTTMPGTDRPISREQCDFVQGIWCEPDSILNHDYVLRTNYDIPT